MEQLQSNIPNLLGMARTAVEAGNSDEAVSYFNRVLEIDPTVSEAWMGKGRAVAQQSTLQQVRLRETVVAFGHAIGSAPASEQEAVAAAAIAELTTLGRNIFVNAQGHWSQFRSLPSAWATCVGASAAVLDALEAGLAWQPGYFPAQLEIVTICAALLNQGVAPELEDVLRVQMDRTVTAIREQHPDFEPPALAAESESAKVARQIEAKNNSDAIGYFVLFIVLVLGAILTAVTRAKG